MTGNNNDRQPCVGTMIGQWQGNSVYPDAIPVSWVLMHVSMPATSVFDLFSPQLVPIWRGWGDFKALLLLMREHPREYQRRAGFLPKIEQSSKHFQWDPKLLFGANIESLSSFSLILCIIIIIMFKMWTWQAQILIIITPHWYCLYIFFSTPPLFLCSHSSYCY